MLLPAGEHTQSLLVRPVKPGVVQIFRSELVLWVLIAASQVGFIVDVESTVRRVGWVAVSVNGKADVLGPVDLEWVMPPRIANFGQLPAPFYKVIAAEHCTVVLDGQLVMAGSIQNAKRHRSQDHFVQYGVKDAHAHATTEFVKPQIENTAQKLSVGIGFRTVRRQEVLCRIVWRLHPLNGWDELHPAPAQIEQVIQDLIGVTDVVLIEDTEDVVVHVMLAQQLVAAHDHVTGPGTAVCQAIVIMKVWWTIHTQTNEKLFLSQKTAPLIIQ